MVPDLIKFLFDDPNAQDQIKEKGLKMFVEYRDKCEQTGTHMNSMICLSTQSAAESALKLLNAAGLIGDTVDDQGLPLRDDLIEAKIIANIFGSMSSSIVRLDTDFNHHKP